MKRLRRTSFSFRQTCARGDRECRASALGLRLAGASDWLTAADPNIHGARDNPAGACLVDDAQIAVMQSELHGFGGSGIEMDALEPSQRAKGSALDAGMRKIQLHYFIAGHGTGVRNANGCGYRAICRDLGLAHFCVRVI